MCRVLRRYSCTVGLTLAAMAMAEWAPPVLLLALGGGGEAHGTGTVGSAGSHAAPGAWEGDLLGDVTWSAAAARGGAPPLLLSPREAGTHSVAQAGAADTLLLLASLSGMRPAAYVLLGGFVVSVASLYLALSSRLYMEHPGGGAPPREWWWWRGVVAAAGLAGSVLHESSMRAMFALHLRLKAGSEGHVERQPWLLSEVRRIDFSIYSAYPAALRVARCCSACALHGPEWRHPTHIPNSPRPPHPPQQRSGGDAAETAAPREERTPSSASPSGISHKLGASRRSRKSRSASGGATQSTSRQSREERQSCESDGYVSEASEISHEISHVLGEMYDVQEEMYYLEHRDIRRFGASQIPTLASRRLFAPIRNSSPLSDAEGASTSPSLGQALREARSDFLARVRLILPT